MKNLHVSMNDSLCYRSLLFPIIIFFLLIPTSQLEAQCGPGSCEVCGVNVTITSVEGGNIIDGSVDISGNVEAGETGTGDNPLVIEATGCGTISLTLELDFVWDQGVNQNWIHGISFFNSAGWVAAEGTIIPPDNGWIFLDEITGLCTGETYGAGYYWDPPGTNCGNSGNLSSYDGSDCTIDNSANATCEATDAFLVDGDPSDNWGIDCSFSCPQFGFNLTYCPSGAGTVDEDITFYLTEDGETGGWSEGDGCIFELTFPITIQSAGVQLPEFDEVICQGECFTLDAGEGCEDYEWSTGETTQSIEVCPTETTTYGVTVSGAEGCIIEGESTILIEFCCEAEAGTLDANTPVCPGASVNYTVTNYNDSDDYTEVVLIVDENGLVVEIVNGDSGSFTSLVCGTFSIYSYNYYTAGDSPVPFIGMDISIIDCQVECCDLEEFEISFEDNEMPTFPNAPGDVSYTCIDDLPAMEDQMWEDNCDGTGSVSGVEDGSSTLCDGGTFTRTWEYTDVCGNMGQHVQTITIEPVMEASFDNLPQDETVNCENIPSSFDNLNYTNGQTGSCAIMGNVPAVVVEDYSPLCGGTIMATWEFTDICNRTISHTQTITIEPAPEAAFVNAPGDMTLACTTTDLTPMPLSYTNGSACLISGMVDPVIDQNYDPLCGGTITATWEFTDPCDRTISHTQTITIDPAPEASFTNLPVDMTLTCAGQNFVAEVLNYDNSSLDCPIQGMVTPQVVEDFDPICGGTITATWEFTDPCNRSLSHTQVITIEPAPEAMFVNPPMDMTLTCAEQEIVINPLSFTNNDAGCLIEGSAMPMIEDNANLCGGSIVVTWEFTDPCSRTITHQQTFTVEPAAPAVFINPPADMTILCSDPTPVFEDLMYTNNGTGVCLISGSVSPTVEDNSNSCGGEIIATWSFTDDCDQTIEHSQTIMVEPVPQAMFTNPPTNLTVSCANIPAAPQNLAYTNNDVNCPIEGEVAPDVIEDYDICGGMITYIWEFTDECDRTINHLQVITIEPAPQAAFTALPMDLQMSCAEFGNFTPEDLDYSNGATGDCLIAGSIAGVTSDELNECGGTIEILYEFTDDCDRTISHTQTITVEPAAMAAFTSFPENMTLDCNQIGIAPQPLDYTNGESGDCLIEGSVEAIIAGTADECGGVVSHIWTFTDECNRTISHTQVITYNPASEPVWVDPPEDGFLDCDGELPDDLSLEYDNFEDFPCTIAGIEEPEITQVGNIITLTWTFTNPCTNVTITNVQTYEQSIPVDWEEEYLEFTICEGDEFDLSSIQLIDQNNTDPTITYHDDFPTSPSNEIDNPVVSPLFSSTYFIEGNNIYDCPDFVEVYIDLENISVAGSDFEGEICIDEQVLDLYDFTAQDADFDGDFFQTSGPTLNIGDPESVNIASAAPGTYTFDYVIEATDYCPEDMAVITIELLPPVEIQVTGISCADDFQTYMVDITNNGYDIDFNFGEFFDINFNSATIGNIPIDETLEIEASVIGGDCEATFFVSPPNCDCPDVEAPISNGDAVICFGDPNPTLTVSVNGNLTANWWDAPIGGTELINGSLSYTPVVTDPGVYTFYVESESLDDPGCKSATRVPVILEILSGPPYSDVEFELCDEDQDGIMSLDSLALQDILNINPTESVIYYNSITDANANINPLTFPITNASPFTFGLAASISNSSGCVTIIQLNITVHAKPNLSAIISPESCMDAADGSFMIDAFDSNAQYTLDNVSLTSAETPGLEPATYELVIVDAFGCSDSLDIVIDPGLDMSFDSFVWDCSDNGTNTDPEDDIYQITFTINNNAHPLSTEYIVTNEGGDMLGTFTYGTEGSFTIGADGSSQILTFTDSQNGCSIEQSIGPLSPCSTNCVIEVDELLFECNSNNTGSDPSDDFYTVSILASAINGSSVNRYNVAINGVITFSFEYGILSNLTLPADNSIVTLTLTDAEDLACSVNVPVGPLSPCSDDCSFDLDISNINCDDNGTDDNNDDDIFFFDLLVDGVNVGTSFEITELAFMGMYGQSYNLGPYDISAGSIQITLVDVDDPNCSITELIEPPNACSDCNQTMELSEPTILSCANPETDITVTTSEQGIFQWTGPDGFNSTQATITVSVPGVYEVLVSFFNGCTLTGSVEVFSDNNIPIALAGPDQLLTCEQLSVVLDASNSIYPSSAIFEWTDATGTLISNELQITVDQAGTYYFVIIDPLTGCNSAVEEVIVAQDNQGPSVVIFADPGNILDCFVETINLTSAQEEHVIYDWILNGALVNSQQLSISEASEITLIALDTITGCENESDFSVLDLTEFPIVILEQAGDIDCDGGDICLDASSSPFASNLDFVWYDAAGNQVGSNDPVFCSNVAGEYTVELTDPSNGCVNSESISIEGSAILANISLPQTIIVPPGTDGTITVDIDIPLSEVAEIIWSPAELLSCNDCVTTTILNPSDGQVFTVEVVTISGCRSTASTILDQDIIIEVNIPNIFNPDSGSGNDHFTLYGNEQVVNIKEMFVYDRWGELVYYAENIPPNDPALGWDGRFKGQLAAQGVYVYLFNVDFVNGEGDIFTGDLSLIR